MDALAINLQTAARIPAYLEFAGSRVVTTVPASKLASTRMSAGS